MGACARKGVALRCLFTDKIAAMTVDQIIACAVLFGALCLFVWGRYRYDLVALLALFVVTVAGLVPPEDILSGFGHPAVITVAAVLTLSRGLSNSGVVELISSRIEPLSRHLILHIVALSAVCAVASAFMNNVGALALMLPVALSTCKVQDRPPALVLMPLAFASILGGLMTMIGTPPNIIIATYRSEISGAPFGMFDFSPVGVPIAVVGIIYIAVLGWRLVPKERRGNKSPDDLFQLDDYITEVEVQADSPLLNKNFGFAESEMGQDVVIAGRLRRSGMISKPARREIVQEGDILTLKADPKDLKSALEKFGLALHGEQMPRKLEQLESQNIKLFEAVVQTGSPVEGRTPAYLRLRSGFTLHLLAVARSGKQIRNRIKDVNFEAGDVLLMQGDQDSGPDTLSDLRLLPLPERGLRLGAPRKTWLSLAIFALAIAASMVGGLPIAVAFIGAIIAYVLLDIIPTRELYNYIDWPVIVLLGAMIPVGNALQATGATDVLAGQIVSATSVMPTYMVLAIIMMVTMTLSDVINNAATALIMAPLSVAIAKSLGVSADPFLMSVALGASCAFLTPIGHQSNTLVMGPAGYHFSDYWRVGLPLEALIVVISVPLILLFWPLAQAAG